MARYHCKVLIDDPGRRSIHHHGTNFDVHAVAALARDCNALQEERKINKSVYKLVTDIGTFVFTTLLYAMRAAMTDQQWPSLAQAFIYHNLHAILPLPAVLDDNDVLMPDPIDDYIDGGRDGLSASVAKIYSDPSAAYLITKIAKCDDDTRQQQSVDNVFAQKCLSALQSRRGQSVFYVYDGRPTFLQAMSLQLISTMLPMLYLPNPALSIPVCSVLMKTFCDKRHPSLIRAGWRC